MTEITVTPEELDTLAGVQDQAAAQANTGVQATATVDLHAVLYETQGPICGPSNDAITANNAQRIEAGRAIQQACLALAQSLTDAATAYTSTDDSAARDINTQMPT